MKKILSILLTLIMVFGLVQFASATESGFNANVKIEKTATSITVTVLDESGDLAKYAPTLTVPCSFSEATVKLNGSKIAHTLSGGYIAFKVKSAGDYVITEGAEAQSVVTDVSAGGGSSAAAAVTVKVEGDKAAVQIAVAVEGNEAKIEDVKATDIEKIGEGEAVTFDVSSLGSNVAAVTLTKTTVANVAGSDASGIEVKTAQGTIALDSDVLGTMEEAGKDVTLTLNTATAAEKNLSAEQKSAIQGLGNSLVVEVSLQAGGKDIHELGGDATISVPVPTTMGNKNVIVYYLDAQGVLTLMETTVVTVNGVRCVQFKTNHFSQYILVESTESVLAQFTDITSSNVHFAGIEYCVANNLMNGMGKNLFKPKDSISRAQIVTMLWRMAGSPAVDYVMNFSDVKEDFWYTEAIRWANAEGIVNGYANGTFAPNKSITREELATILYRYEQIVNKGGFTGTWMFLLDYADRSVISSWANEAMHWMVMKQIVKGDTHNKLNPKATATRGEAATMMMRYCTAEK